MTANTGTAVPNNIVREKRHGFFYYLFRRLLREKPLGTIGLAIVIILFIVGIFAPFLAPYGMNEMNLADRLQGSSAKHLLGTDQVGRDELSRLIYGARVSMVIGILATAISQAESIVIGIISGFLGGKIDSIIGRLIDIWMSIPGFVMLMTIMNVINNTSGSVWPITWVLGLTGGIAGSRVIRSSVISIKSNTYVSAADAIGCGPIRTMVRHILPNVMSTIIVSFTIGIGGVIMAEASLSFLGFGVPPNIPSWGSMLSQEGRQYMQSMPTLALWPGLALTIVVYGINMFGDSLRDLLDPRLRGGVGRYTLNQNKLRKIKANVVKS